MDKMWFCSVAYIQLLDYCLRVECVLWVQGQEYVLGKILSTWESTHFTIIPK